MTKFQIGPNPNFGKSVYINSVFFGLYDEKLGSMTNSSNIPGQIFNVNLMVKFMKSQYPDTKLYSYIYSDGKQSHAKVSIEKFLITSGVLAEH